MKVISINVQKNLHTESIIDFLKKESPDVVCLQEVFKEDVERYKTELAMDGIYNQGIIINLEDEIKHSQGLAVLSRLPIISYFIIPYTDVNDLMKENEVSVLTHLENKSDRVNIMKVFDRKLLGVDIIKDNKKYRVATTHFTWGYYGCIDSESKKFVFNIDNSTLELQIADATRLLRAVDLLQEVILCANLNSPRGGVVFSMLAEKLKDNIPKEYDSSIDSTMHRAGHLPLMVDTFFTTEHYKATNVVLKSGISDHMAVVGEVEKVC